MLKEELAEKNNYMKFEVAREAVDRRVGEQEEDNPITHRNLYSC